MSFTNWLKGMLTGNKTIEIASKDVEDYIDKHEMQKLALEEFYIHVAINMISNSISKCEFKTFQDGKETFGEEYYLWNYEPNKNQNSSQFLQELLTRLLYFGECLVVEVAGQLIIAENFYQEEYAVKENVFTNVSRKNITFNKTFLMSEVLYYRLSNINIRKLLNSLCSGYSKLISEAIDKFEKSGGERGTVTIDALKVGQQLQNSGKTFDEVMEEMMNVRFKKFFNSKNAVMPLFEGYKYDRLGTETSKKSTSEVKDITDLTKEVIEKVSIAFNIPPALLKGEIADVKDVTKNYLTFGIDPYAEMICEENNRKRYGHKQLQQKSYMTIDTTTVMHRDIFDIAESIDKLLSDGMYNVDELRRKVGDAELNTEHSKKYCRTKNYTETE